MRVADGVDRLRDDGAHVVVRPLGVGPASGPPGVGPVLVEPGSEAWDVGRLLLGWVQDGDLPRVNRLGRVGQPHHTPGTRYPAPWRLVRHRSIPRVPGTQYPRGW